MRTFGPSELWFILPAARWTVALIAFAGGAVGGLLVALGRTSENRLVQWLSRGFIQIFQSTPLLLPLFVVFFGAPVLGFDVDPWVAAGVALILNSSAFPDEIWRGCIRRFRRAKAQFLWPAAVYRPVGRETC